MRSRPRPSSSRRPSGSARRRSRSGATTTSRTGPPGFQARHSLVIRCPDIEAAGGLLTALADAVGDRLEIEGVSLEVSDQTAATAAAREAAYADAVERATHLAGLAGAGLGDVQDVVEGGGFGGGPVRAAAKAMSAAASFQPGETVDRLRR